MAIVLKLAIRDLLYHHVFYSHDSVIKISKIVTWTCLRVTGPEQYNFKSDLANISMEELPYE